MRVKTVPILMLLSGLLVSVIATVAQPHPQENADQLPEWEAMGMMRTINTLQAVASSNHGHFLSLEELASQRHEQSHEIWLSTVLLKDSSTGTLKNYQVSIVVSPDRQHYVSEMISSSKPCDPAIFSNESGVIYTAKGLGCESEKTPNKDPQSRNE